MMLFKNGSFPYGPDPHPFPECASANPLSQVRFQSTRPSLSCFWTNRDTAQNCSIAYIVAQCNTTWPAREMPELNPMRHTRTGSRIVAGCVGCQNYAVQYSCSLQGTETSDHRPGQRSRRIGPPSYERSSTLRFRLSAAASDPAYPLLGRHVR